MIHYHLIAVLRVGITQLDKDLSGFAFAGGLADCLKTVFLGRILDGFNCYSIKAFLMSEIQKTRIDNEVLTFECDYEPLLKLWPLIDFLVLSLLDCHDCLLLLGLERGIVTVTVAIFETSAIGLYELDPVGD